METITSKDDSKTSELLDMNLCEWEVKIFERTAPVLTDRWSEKKQFRYFARLNVEAHNATHTELLPVSCPLFYTISLLTIEAFFPKTALGLIQSSL